MSLSRIIVTPLSTLLASHASGHEDGNCTFVEDVSPAGQYCRRTPFQMDVAELEADQVDLLASYLGHERQNYDAVRHVVLHDAIVTGQGSVITSDLRLIRESAAEFVAHGVAPTNFSDLKEDSLSLDIEDVRYIERPSLLVKRPWYRNYGHWLVDGAALLALAWKMNLPPNWQIVVGDLNGSAMHSVLRQTLEILAPGIDVVEHRDGEIWKFKELHYISPVSIPPLFKLPESLEGLRSIFLHTQLPKIRSQRGIFVTRGPMPSRRLGNESEIVEICRSFGMSVVSPESMPIADQAQLFRNSQVVVGVKGASLTNTLFCRPSVHVIALSPGDFPDPFFWDVVAQYGGGYSEIFGRISSRSSQQGGNPFSIDPEIFRAILGRCMQDRAF